jgi:hypothetical protein
MHSLCVRQSGRKTRLTPQFADLTVHPRYPGEGELLPHGDPPIPVTGCLPCPLGSSAEWFDVCPLEDIQFRELYELAKITPPAECRREMNATFRCVQVQWHVDNPKPDRFGISAGTTGDIVTILLGWQHNPESVPAPIRGESDGTLNVSDIDVWMWLRNDRGGLKSCVYHKGSLNSTKLWYSGGT